MTNLYTPDGRPAILPVEGIRPAEMMIIAQMADICARHKISLVCPKCDASFVGRNGSSDRTWSITCGCRELKAEVGFDRRPA